MYVCNDTIVCMHCVVLTTSDSLYAKGVILHEVVLEYEDCQLVAGHMYVRIRTYLYKYA